MLKLKAPGGQAAFHPQPPQQPGRARASVDRSPLLPSTQTIFAGLLSSDPITSYHFHNSNRPCHLPHLCLSRASHILGPAPERRGFPPSPQSTQPTTMPRLGVRLHWYGSIMYATTRPPTLTVSIHAVGYLPAVHALYTITCPMSSYGSMLASSGSSFPARLTSSKLAVPLPPAVRSLVRQPARTHSRMVC